jgi:hypothetical protein
MDEQQHRRQGLALAIAGLLLAVALFVLIVLMGGFAPSSPEALVIPAAFVLIAAGAWGLWRARRYGLAWTLMVGLPSLALGCLIGFFILFALGIS